jgi:four helix bundle protein
MNVSTQPPRNIEDRTFKFAVRIIKLCEFLARESWVDAVPGGQLLRCGPGIGTNIEEAQAAQSRGDFANKNNISLKGARKAHNRLGLLAAAEVVLQSHVQPLLDESLALNRILGAIVISAIAVQARNG